MRGEKGEGMKGTTNENMTKREMEDKRERWGNFGNVVATYIRGLGCCDAAYLTPSIRCMLLFGGVVAGEGGRQLILGGWKMVWKFFVRKRKMWGRKKPYFEEKKLGAILRFWAPMIFSVGKLQLSVRRLQIAALPSLFNSQRRGLLLALCERE